MTILKFCPTNRIPELVLAGLLLFFSSTQLLAGILNAESFLFGFKLSGAPALIHTFSNVGMGSASLFFLRSHTKASSSITASLFGYMLVNVQFIQNSDGVIIPTVLWSLGLIVSLTVLLQKVMKNNKS